MLFMCALGIQTDVEQIKKVGPKPFILAALLAVWLVVGGYGMTLFILG